MNLELLKVSVRRSEDLKLKLYKCPADKTSIGYGRNIQDRGISKKEAEFMLENDLLDVKLELHDRVKFFSSLDDVRQNVLIEMGFNMGVPKLLKFKNTLSFIKNNDFLSASQEMLNSKWHRDFIEFDMKDGKKFGGLLRSEYLSEVMEKGSY